MITLRRLRESRAARNAAASYLAFVSTSLCGLVSIPIAVAYLSKAQMGLWTIVFSVVGYLLWLDLGIGNATGRKIADALAADDHSEINRWWTLSIGILTLLGGTMIVAALAISPFLAGLLNISPGQTGDALWLFLGTAVVSAVGMPVRAYPGILTAQERFHWVPLVQSVIPWIQLGAFWWLLHAGFGVRSYFPALALSQLSGWAFFLWQVHGKGLKVRVDFSGWTKPRFHELFSYSSSLAVSGVIGSVIQSLPALVLARFGGLPLVPVYNLSNRGPGMVNSLTQRTAHSFYPNLQKLYVSGERLRFRNKYRQVNQLGIWIGLIGAGGVLAGNRSLISWLAKADFYAGVWPNIWFACAVLTVPFAGAITNLLQYSGKMGKSAVFSIIELPLGILLCWAGYHWAGLAGLAAAFALLPMLVRAPYSLYAGPAYCGFRSWDLCGSAILTLLFSLVLVIGGGCWSGASTQTPAAVEIFGRATTLPTLREITIGSLLAVIGAVQAVRHLHRIKGS